MAKKALKSRFYTSNSLPPESAEALNTEELRNSRKGSTEYYSTAQKALNSCISPLPSERKEGFDTRAKRNIEELGNRGRLNLSAGQSIRDLADKNADMKEILGIISAELSTGPSTLSDKYNLFSAEIEYKKSTGEERRRNKEMKSAIEAVKALLSGYGSPAHRIRLEESMEPQREVLELALNANSINTLFNMVLPKLVASEPDEINQAAPSSKRSRTQ